MKITVKVVELQSESPTSTPFKVYTSCKGRKFMVTSPSNPTIPESTGIIPFYLMISAPKINGLVQKIKEARTDKKASTANQVEVFYLVDVKTPMKCPATTLQHSYIMIKKCLIWRWMWWILYFRRSFKRWNYIFLARSPQSIV